MLACWRDDKSAAGRTKVLARWRDNESVVGQTMVLACSCDNGVDGKADDGDLASLAVPRSLVQQRVRGRGGVCSLAQRRVSGGAYGSARFLAARLLA